MVNVRDLFLHSGSFDDIHIDAMHIPIESAAVSEAAVLPTFNSRGASVQYPGQYPSDTEDRCGSIPVTINAFCVIAIGPEPARCHTGHILESL